MITIGSKEFESYKTTLPAPNTSIGESFDVDCATDDVNAITSFSNAIKTKTYNLASSLNVGSGLYEIATSITDTFLHQKASGRDYLMRFEYTYTVAPSGGKLLYTYTQTGANQFYKDITSLVSGVVDYHISDLNCTGGVYTNDYEEWIFSLTHSVAFDLELKITVIEETPTTIIYNPCTEGETTLLVLNNEAIGETQSVYYSPEDILFTPTFVRSRELFKDPVELGSCSTFDSTHYTIIYSDVVSDNLDTYVFSATNTKIKASIISTAAITNDMRLIYTNAGLAQTQIVDCPAPSGAMLPTFAISAEVPLTVTLDEEYKLEVYEMILGVPTLYGSSVFVETTLIHPSLVDEECPCACSDGCIEELITITWRNNCGELITTQIDGQIKGGQYSIEGEGFKTYTGDEIFPEITQKNEYTLVINKYSDEVFKAIAYLISNNLDIEINGVRYLIKPLVLTPSWDTYSRYGSLQIPIIEKDSINTIRRNCC